MRHRIPVVLALVVLGCVPTEEVSITVEAGVAFSHVEPVVLESEGYTFTETGVPSGLTISSTELDELLFEGTLDAGTYPFTLDFEHYGDDGSTRTRWDVTITSE